MTTSMKFQTLMSLFLIGLLLFPERSFAGCSRDDLILMIKAALEKLKGANINVINKDSNGALYYEDALKRDVANDDHVPDRWKALGLAYCDAVDNELTLRVEWEATSAEGFFKRAIDDLSSALINPDATANDLTKSIDFAKESLENANRRLGNAEWFLDRDAAGEYAWLLGYQDGRDLQSMLRKGAGDAAAAVAIIKAAISRLDCPIAYSPPNQERPIHAIALWRRPELCGISPAQPPRTRAKS